MDIKTFETKEAVSHCIAQGLLKLSQSEQIAHIALSGGSTPKALFEYIATSEFAQSIAWSNLHFWWGDERCVPANHPESNFGEAMRLLFSRIHLPVENLHPIHGELQPEKACLDFKAEMEALLPVCKTQSGERPQFDWILLGVGEDGHTASLFPKQTDYQAPTNAIVAPHPESGQLRISLTAPAICAARRITYLALGESKQAILAEILSHPSDSSYPAANIVAWSGATEWYLDTASANQLTL